MHKYNCSCLYTFVWGCNMGLFGIFSSKNNRPSSNNPVSVPNQQEKIAVLLNARVVKENVTKQQWIQLGKIVEEKMLYYVALPYQICDCSYIGESKAWAMYNLNNKAVLRTDIDEINVFFSTVGRLEQGMLNRIIPTDYHIDFNAICFDYGQCVSMDALPRSYLLYTPETKSGKKAQYPLVAFFNTIANSPSDHAGENYTGELHYAITGEVAKATVFCWKHGKFAEFNFSVIGRTFMISSIRMHNTSGRLATIYDSTWALTDYIDFPVS